MAAFRFFIYSNLFMACCAVLMACQTYQLLLQAPPDLYFTGFVFFSTLCSYSFHWYLESATVLVSERAGWRHRFHSLHLTLFFIGLAGSAVFFFFLIEHWFWLVFAAVITFLYSAPKIPHPYFRSLRKVAIGKTIFLAMVWMYVTTILPLIVSEHPWRDGFYLFITGRFFFIYAICILFDYRDRSDDKIKGIRSLITWLSETGITNLFVFSLLVYTAATLSLLLYQYDLFTVFILLIPGAIIAALYKQAKKNFSDIFYYFLLDGLMALPAILTLVTGI